MLLKQAGLTVKFEKHQFGELKIKYLGALLLIISILLSHFIEENSQIWMNGRGLGSIQNSDADTSTYGTTWQQRVSNVYRC